MYLRRKIDTYLENWKNNPERKPLIIKGARQTGKTESILQFANLNYPNVVYINFALEPKYLRITADGYSVQDVIRNITFIDPSKKIIAGKTLIVFDEIQDNPDIATTLKSFNTDKQYDVICSGSLLGLHYKKIHSNSVGNKTDYEMHSMDFEEFLWANGYSDEQINEISSNMISLKPFTQAQMSALSSLFMDFCILGGMPAVISHYVEHKNFSGSLEIQRQILLDYEEDIRKYAKGLEQTKITSVYRNIPVQLAKEYKKFQYTTIGKDARSRDYQGCVDWLKDSGIVSICYCLNFPELPLLGNYKESFFKLYFADTGLLVAKLDEEAQTDLRVNKNLGVYKGALYENFVAEGLSKQGYELFYYKKNDSTLEEDFFVRNSSSLIPVEVKSSSNKKAKSLKELIQGEKYHDISFGIKFTPGNIGFANNTISFPYFCVFKLKEFLNSYKAE